jgi:hypothetical protein
VVLCWTAAISIATGVLFGGVAAVFVGSHNVADVLRNEVRTSSGGNVARRMRATLIVGQIALSFALLVGTGLLIRSFVALQDRPIGFDARRLASIDILTPPSIRRSGRLNLIREEVGRRLRQTPGVVDAAMGTIPTAGYRVPGNLAVATPDGDRSLDVSLYTTTWITKEFFHTSGIALAGRLPVPGATDTLIVQAQGPAAPPAPGSSQRSAQPLPPPPGPLNGPMRGSTDRFRSLSEEIVINRALARRISPDGNALGARLRVSGGQLAPMAQDNDWSTVVGIADDVQLPGAHGDLNAYQVYTLPLARGPDPTYVVRFASLPSNVESTLRHAIQTVDPTIVVRRAKLAEDYVREALAPTRFTLALLGAFSLVALVLSVVGLYASIAYSVSQRTREFGIRIALGATSREIGKLVVGDGFRVVAAGIVLGIVVSMASTRSLSALLYGVSSADGVTFVGITLLVAVIALAASVIPARRATRIDPTDALRAD